MPCSENWTLPEVAILAAFSSPEDALLLVSTKNLDLWQGPIFLACAENSYIPCPEVAILGADQKERGLRGL